MKSHDEMLSEWMKDPEFKSEYHALEAEFVLFDMLFEARNKAGLTQEDVARRIGTKAPVIARIESGGGKKKHSPSLTTLQKYAEAVGCKLEIRLIPLGL